MKIIQSPHELLRLPARPADLPPDKLAKIIAEMTQTLLSCRNPHGVGLAANQVGLPYCIFLAKFSSKKLEPVRVFINPEIIAHSEEFQPEDKKAPLEGCLSLPKYYGVVKRWQWIKIEYQMFPNTPDSLIEKTETFTGFPATVIQHEMDHLNGKIFVERILEQDGKLYKIISKDKKGKEKWEEVAL